MADAMLAKEKGDKTPKTSFEEELLKMDDEEISYEDKGKGPAKRKNTKTAVKVASSAAGSKVTNKNVTKASKQSQPTETNKGHGVSLDQNLIIQMLNDMRNEQNQKFTEMNKRIDELYEYDENDEYEHESYDEEQDEVDEVQHNDDNEACNDNKKRKADSEESRFSSMNKRFRFGEKCSSNIDEQLAEIITGIFRNGISDDKFSELMKEEKVLRPENCEGLMAVQTDQLIWELLFPRTKTNDNKLRRCQNIAVKGATLLSGIVDKLDKILKRDNLQYKPEFEAILDDGMDALALFGHANKELCLTRRELMKPDVKNEYNHLFNKTQPFNKWLFGGDVSKQVKDIGECSKISNRLSANQYGSGNQFGSGRPGRYYPRRRGGRLRGGRGGRGRGSSRSDDKMESKNSRWNKYKT